MKPSLSSRSVGAVSGAVLTLALAAPAAAHVSIIDGAAVPAGGHGTQITLRVPHGCDGAATTAIEVQVPEGVTGVKPGWMAGWTIETEPRATIEASAAAEASTQPTAPDVGLIRWTGGPLPDGQYLDFRLLAVFPDTPGTMYLPVVQRCGDVEVAWIQVPAEGQSEDDLERPAPAVSVIEGETDEH